VDYALAADSPVAGRQIGELGLPEGAIVALVARDGQLIPPKGGTRLMPGDHLFVIAPTGERPAVEETFTLPRKPG
jgi:cell volume regulation protein A